MNNLHRELAPISDAAWTQIEQETSRTLKRHLAGRRVVDLHGPAGASLSAVGTGHLLTISAPRDGVVATQREVKALVELRVPFELERQTIDDVAQTTRTGSRRRMPRASSLMPRTVPYSKAMPPLESWASGRGPAIRR